MQTAFTNFFAGRAKYPNFNTSAPLGVDPERSRRVKKKRNGGSAEFTKSAFKFKAGLVYLAKCKEPLPIRWSRQLPNGCTPSTITVKLDPSGRWFVSLRIDDLADHKLKPIKKKIGIDLGISSLFTTSDGEKVANPKHYNELYKKLRLAQKSLSRKTKGSKNREKARVKVARIQSKIADSRRDHTHKLTTQLIRENQTICVEDLPVKNLILLTNLTKERRFAYLVRELPQRIIGMRIAHHNQYSAKLAPKYRWYVEFHQLETF